MLPVQPSPSAVPQGSPGDDWTLVYEGLDAEREGLREALCTLGNGYVATRGAAPESRADGVHYPGTYFAGVYDRLVSDLDGRQVENEDLVNAPNWLPLTFRADDGPWLDLGSMDVFEYRQELDLRQGLLVRAFRVRDGFGRTTAVRQRRLVSMHDEHLAALETTLTVEDWSGPLEIVSGLDAAVVNAGVRRYRDLRGDHLQPPVIRTPEDDVVALVVPTTDSRVRIAEACRTRLTLAGREPAAVRETRRHDRAVDQLLRLEVEPGSVVTVEKTVALFTSRDRATYRPLFQACGHVAGAPSFEELVEDHRLAWDHHWQRFDTRIELSEESDAQLVLRLHIFHLLQTISEKSIDVDAGIPARGLHGEAYRGHVFWDALFILPLLDLHLPVLSREHIDYRYHRLEAARRRARDEGCRGALFPWQSGSDGREESQSWHLNPRSGRWIRDNSHLQRHINLAIAWDAWHLYQVTGDLTNLRFRSGPIIIEAARAMACLATYDDGRERYEIRGVMGPDEYHDAYPDADEPGLDNNAYTNVMTVWCLCRALEILDLLADYQRRELWDALHLAPDEVERWEDISTKMFVPHHGDGVISQFEGYEALEELDWDRYRRRYGDIMRLDRILEAEGDTPNRYKASKQADVLMLFYLLSATELTDLFARIGYEFDAARDIPKNVEYYLQRTSHGSTLSTLVHSWVLSRLDRERSWRLFLSALDSDVGDVQGGTTSEGVHLGAMAGTVDLVQRCYCGIEVRDDVLWLDPRLPEEMTSLRMPLHYRGHRIDLTVTSDELQVTALPGVPGPVCVGLRGEVVEMQAGEMRRIGLGEVPRS